MVPGPIHCTTGCSSDHHNRHLQQLLCSALLVNIQEKLLRSSSTEPPSWGSKFFSGRRLQLIFTPQGMHCKAQALQLAVQACKINLDGVGCSHAILVIDHWAVSSPTGSCTTEPKAVLASKTTVSSPSIWAFPTCSFTMPSIGSPDCFSSL
uniref:Uncharacterized protein n=1 Tax=Molossus molossus TaxID=27622 RepID=A0A7J8HCX6_MOLMO|nr:hypothetical protein HJG59_011153 [Molossus molossus]